MQYKLCDDTWDQAEIEAIHRVIESNRFSMGEEVRQYEEEFAKLFQVRYAVMVSSGSAANLLAIAALVYSGRIQKGEEVLVPAVSWSTTYFPLYQMGLKLRFLDINEFAKILEICKRRNLILIEDNCESLGGVYQGKKLGTFGLLGTYSTFYSHHLCTMEGGIVVTNEETLYHYMLSIRAHGWTRNLPKNSSIYQKNEMEFYESYHFIVPGFNLRPIEMEGAIGKEQLKKMETLIENRRKNAAYFQSCMARFSEIRLQKEIEQSSWFGFSIVLEGKYQGKRDFIVKRLEEKGVEVRPIVAGNFTRNPVIQYLEYSIYGKLEQADWIHENGFFVGNHSQEDRTGIDYFLDCFSTILGEVSRWN